MQVCWWPSALCSWYMLMRMIHDHAFLHLSAGHRLMRMIHIVPACSCRSTVFFLYVFAQVSFWLRTTVCLVWSHIILKKSHEMVLLHKCTSWAKVFCLAGSFKYIILGYKWLRLVNAVRKPLWSCSSKH